MLSFCSETVRKFRPVIQFNNFRSNPDARILSLAITSDGSNAFAASNYNSLDVFDCSEGKQTQTVQLIKYGCGEIVSGNSNEKLLISTTRRDNVIRLLNIERFTYEMCFDGHLNHVKSIEYNTCAGLLMSSSVDHVMRLWDMRMANCVSEIGFESMPIVRWHPRGNMIAAGTESQTIEFYDIRRLNQDVVTRFRLNKDPTADWERMTFSPCGKKILISTNGTHIYLADSIYGKTISNFSEYFVLLNFHSIFDVFFFRYDTDFAARKNLLGIAMDAEFSPDGEFIFGGSSDGQINVWSLSNRDYLTKLTSNHAQAIRCIRFNPNCLLMITGSSNVSFWSPENDLN